jgi:hypothetical protein
VVNGEIDPVILAVPSSVHHVLMEVLKNSFRATIQRYGEHDVHKAPPVTITILPNTTPAGITMTALPIPATPSSPPPKSAATSKEQSVLSDSDYEDLLRISGYPAPNTSNPTTPINTASGITGSTSSSGSSTGNSGNDDHDLTLWNTLRNQGTGHASVSIMDHGVGLSPIERFRCWQWMYTTAPRVADESGYTYSRRFGAPFTGLGVGLPTARQYTRALGITHLTFLFPRPSAPPLHCLLRKFL